MKIKTKAAKVLDVSGDWKESVAIDFRSPTEDVFNRLVSLVRVSVGRGLYDHEVVDCVLSLGIIGNRLLGGKSVLLSDTDTITMMKAFTAEGFSVDLSAPVSDYDSDGVVKKVKTMKVRKVRKATVKITPKPLKISLPVSPVSLDGSVDESLEVENERVMVDLKHGVTQFVVGSVPTDFQE